MNVCKEVLWLECLLQWILKSPKMKVGIFCGSNFNILSRVWSNNDASVLGDLYTLSMVIFVESFFWNKESKISQPSLNEDSITGAQNLACSMLPSQARLLYM